MRNQILNISVENFLSYNSKQVVDFTKNHISCFVGHNGSGKTNMLLAINELAELYLNPQGEKRRMGPSFDQQKKPVVLSIEFIAAKEKFSYTVESLPAKGNVIKEELRNGDNRLLLDLELKSDIGELSEIEKERITTYSVNDVGIFYLLFSGQVKIQNNTINKAINNVGAFFKSIVYIGKRSYNNFNYEKELYENPETKKMILDFMKKLDYGIDDIIVEKITDRITSLEDLNGGGRNGIKSDHIIKLMTVIKQIVDDMPELDTSYEVKFLKRPYLKNPISMGLESGGVKRLIEMLTWIYANKNRIILVDELEKGFHELLVMSLVSEVNSNVNQFIFTSHLLELMTRNCLLKNQLFSVVKEHGQSIIYPLSDIENIRDDRHSLKNLYRAGKIPGYPLFNEE